MLGRNHVAVSCAAGGAFVSACGALSGAFPEVFSKVSWYFFRGTTGMDMTVVAGSYFGVFLFGILFPDVDSKKSVLGRVLYLPVKHRTITHSVWPLLLFGYLSIWTPYAAVFCLGMFFHLLEDSLSAAGICWFWPFVRYKEYSSGAFVAPGHQVRLYHTGRASESILSVVLIFLFLAAAVCCGVFGRGFERLAAGF